MATHRNLFILPVGLLATAFAVGCNQEDEGRLMVSGTVKLHGQSISDGAIVILEPLENQGTGGNATVAQGAFSIPKRAGLKPGRYLVRVTAGDGKTAVNPVDDNNPPGPSGGTNIISKDLVPAEWNVNSKQEVTVTKEGPNRFDFNIP
jgi:hypothetical protein